MVEVAEAGRRDRYELAVYGATPAGLGAAIAAARAGLRVVVAEPMGGIGGMMTGGLGRTDLGRPETVGGLFREFMGRVVRHYEERYGAGSEQVRDCHGGERFEPSAARSVLGEMVEEAGVEVRLGRRVAGAKVVGGELREVELEAGTGREQVSASVFVEASYEGDLLAAVGAEYRVGRESREEYGEEYAGHLFWGPKGGRPTEEGTGEGDDRVQAYCFRLCLTDDPERRVAIARPPGYEGSQYGLLRAYVEAAPRKLKEVLLLGRLPNGKWDVNNWGFCWQSMDLIGGNAGYVEGSWEEREAIAAAHQDYQWGLLYWLQHEAPAELREEAGRLGWCRDEFEEGEGWPEQLYVREARRMVGRHVFTEHDARRETRKADSVAVGSYPLDSHGTQWYRPGQVTPAPEGFFMCSVGPYEIPYRCMLPESVEGLLVPVCLSATHAGYGTLRMEPVMMNLGMACGEAAALAVEGGILPGEVEVGELQARLEAGGQVIRAPER